MLFENGFSSECWTTGTANSLRPMTAEHVDLLWRNQEKYQSKSIQFYLILPSYLSSSSSLLLVLLLWLRRLLLLSHVCYTLFGDMFSLKQTWLWKNIHVSSFSLAWIVYSCYFCFSLFGFSGVFCFSFAVHIVFFDVWEFFFSFSRSFDWIPDENFQTF